MFTVDARVRGDKVEFGATYRCPHSKRTMRVERRLIPDDITDITIFREWLERNKDEIIAPHEKPATMYLDARTMGGVTQFGFTSLCPVTGKRKRYPRHKVPAFQNKAEALDWLKNVFYGDGKNDAKTSHREARKTWRSKYPTMAAVVARYEEWQRRSGHR